MKLKCAICNGELEIKETSELDEGEAGNPEVKVLSGFCKNCNYTYLIDFGYE